jgi:transcriptional regulator with XRE-family HTH domain
MGDRIKQFLVENSISQRAFADSIGVTEGSVSHYINKGVHPSLAVLEKIRTLYGLDLLAREQPCRELVEALKSFEAFIEVVNARRDKINDQDRIQTSVDLIGSTDLILTLERSTAFEDLRAAKEKIIDELNKIEAEAKAHINKKLEEYSQLKPAHLKE